MIRFALLTFLLPAVALAQMAPPRHFVAPEVKLVEPGSEPRTQLRYLNGADAGIKELETYDVEAAGWWHIEVPANQATRVFPLIKTPVKALRGSTGFGVEFLTPTLVELPDGGYKDTNMEEVMKGLDGVAGWVPTDNRGAAQAITLHPGPNDPKFAVNKHDIEMRSAMGIETAKDLLSRLTVPFPVEPIGKHAKWDVKRYVIRGQIQYDEVAHFELIDFSKGVATLSVRFGGALLANGPYEPGELDLLADGRGEAKVDLKRPLPLSWNDTVDLTATIHSGGLKAQHKAHLTTREQIR